MKIRFPRTWFGWKKLFWTSIRRCPSCHGSLVGDRYNQSMLLLCMPCGGRFVPHGFFEALRQNYREESKNKTTLSKTQEND